MSNVKKASIRLLRLALAFVAMLIAYLVSTTITGESGVVMTQAEQDQAAQGLLVVSLVSALLLSFLIVRSPWHGLKLIGAIFIVQFGIETFMTQIETLYFNDAVQMENAVLIDVAAAGALRATIFAVLATLIFGKLKRSAAQSDRERSALPQDWVKRSVLLTFFYVAVYFVFGYFVAWQWEETRLYYTGTAAIKPFVTHLADLFLREDPWILPFQVLRGGIWTALAILIVRMILAKRWEASLAVALNFSLLMALPLALFPNPYMPPMVKQSHFVELMTSMLLFGAVAGWSMYQEKSHEVLRQPTST
jgi:hypothetical protein